tara:strand:+ start:267 stop:440 length:174 start_codon:yes stop_codon:yes gene_type:complete
MPRKWKPKRRFTIPSWWFALAPNSSYKFWVQVAQHCERKGISKNNRNAVIDVIKELK